MEEVNGKAQDDRSREEADVHARLRFSRARRADVREWALLMEEVDGKAEDDGARKEEDVHARVRFSRARRAAVRDRPKFNQEDEVTRYHRAIEAENQDVAILLEKETLVYMLQKHFPQQGPWNTMMSVFRLRYENASLKKKESARKNNCSVHNYASSKTQVPDSWVLLIARGCKQLDKRALHRNPRRPRVADGTLKPDKKLIK